MRLPSAAITVALVGILGTQYVLTQGDEAYVALLENYAKGPPTEAVRAMAAWPEARVRAAVRTIDVPAVGTMDIATARARARTGMMLHLEAAFEQADDGRESFHLDVARSFLPALLDSRVSVDLAARDFAARWHALTAMLYCTRYDERRARNEINRGPSLDPDHKYVSLVANALVESQITSAYRLLGGRTTEALYQAAQGFRIIIAKPPTLSRRACASGGC
jgi:hypothetical protein